MCVATAEGDCARVLPPTQASHVVPLRHLVLPYRQRRAHPSGLAPHPFCVQASSSCRSAAVSKRATSDVDVLCRRFQRMSIAGHAVSCMSALLECTRPSTPLIVVVSAWRTSGCTSHTCERLATIGLGLRSACSSPRHVQLQQHGAEQGRQGSCLPAGGPVDAHAPQHPRGHPHGPGAGQAAHSQGPCRCPGRLHWPRAHAGRQLSRFSLHPRRAPHPGLAP